METKTPIIKTPCKCVKGLSTTWLVDADGSNIADLNQSRIMETVDEMFEIGSHIAECINEYPRLSQQVENLSAQLATEEADYKELLDSAAWSAKENVNLRQQVEELKEVLGKYQHECDRCGHARIMHLHDGEVGECSDVECYDPKCERFTNADSQTVALEKRVGLALQKVFDVHERMTEPRGISGQMMHGCELCDALNDLRQALGGSK